VLLQLIKVGAGAGAAGAAGAGAAGAGAASASDAAGAARYERFPVDRLQQRALGIQASQKLQAILYNSPHLCFILVSPIDQPINIANGGR